MIKLLPKTQDLVFRWAIDSKNIKSLIENFNSCLLRQLFFYRVIKPHFRKAGKWQHPGLIAGLKVVTTTVNETYFLFN